MQAARTVVHVAIARPARPKAALKRRRPGMFAEFNNAPVDFDVPTRMEAGIPLTPFRQIFEHTGGAIDWNDATQTVHATNSLSDILFRIGAISATVNQKTVKMERRRLSGSRAGDCPGLLYSRFHECHGALRRENRASADREQAKRRAK